jgi:hypothetical protein
MNRTKIGLAVAGIVAAVGLTAAHSAHPAMRVCHTPAAVHFAQCKPVPPRWGGNPPHPTD